MNHSKILVVDDSKVDQLIIQGILDGHDLISAYNGLEAVEKIESGIDLDIVILDLNMPKMNGFEVLTYIRDNIPSFDVPIVILTNYEEIENEIKGLELGAVDYIRKPLNAASLVKRIEVHLSLSRARHEIKLHNEKLEEMVEKRTHQLYQSRDITINALVGLLEVRDIESSNHTKRTTYMMKALCEHLSKKEDVDCKFTEERIKAIYKTTPLHDIGKVGIPDRILLKPGKLSNDEYETMKGHVRYGVDAICSEINDDDVDNYLTTAMKIIGFHHEKFDGTGYPNQLRGKDIPIEGRLMAVVDVYDALASERIYKNAFGHDKAIEMIISEKNKHFDPEIVDAFVEIQDQIHDIAMKYQSKRGGEAIEVV
ncbi:response regulator [Acidaminobacter sp. JC074]|uniref:HD-GYP domain-containing protein n=1 Tax=Acidaminobacter sp. JC074 TaxID=2530199 RepID=UPI001F0F3535|nr:HD domain-containing phosphohydrolase [Acidaminobacter sp. JC074]MCH4886034.1 response regulator [Acidaminobacter sp. JC074]